MDDSVIEDLQVVQKALAAIIEKLTILKDHQKIKQHLMINPSSCYLSLAASGDIPKFSFLKLSLSVDVYCYDKDDKSDTKLDDWSDKQPDWLKQLSLEIPKESPTEWDDPISDDWDYGDWDDPATARTTTPVYLYYIPARKWPKGNFSTLCEDGTIEHWTPKNMPPKDCQPKDVYIFNVGAR